MKTDVKLRQTCIDGRWAAVSNDGKWAYRPNYDVVMNFYHNAPLLVKMPMKDDYGVSLGNEVVLQWNKAVNGWLDDLMEGYNCVSDQVETVLEETKGVCEIDPDVYERDEYCFLDENGWLLCATDFCSLEDIMDVKKLRVWATAISPTGRRERFTKVTVEKFDGPDSLFYLFPHFDFVTFRDLFKERMDSHFAKVILGIEEDEEPI